MYVSLCVHFLCVYTVGAHVPWYACGVRAWPPIWVLIFHLVDAAAWTRQAGLILRLPSCCKNAVITGVCDHVWLYVGSRNLDSGPHTLE